MLYNIQNKSSVSKISSNFTPIIKFANMLVAKAKRNKQYSFVFQTSM